MTDGNLVRGGEGTVVRFRSLGTRHVLDGAVTGGSVAVVEHDLAPGALGSPIHTHAAEDETSHVLSGRLGVQIGDAVLEAGPGDTVWKPRGVPHAFWNPGEETVRFLEVISPAGFERYFDEVAPLLTTGGPPDPDALRAVWARYGLTMDPDSPPRLIAAHGLRPPPG